MKPLMTLSPELIESILKYSGIAGVILLFLYWVFQETLKRKLFATLSQKRRLLVLILTPLLIWSIGVLIIMLDYMRHVPAPELTSGFIYRGQIVDEQGMPLAHAYAYLIFGTDTIKAETETGADGNFTIRLDTIEGIKTTLYYGHPEYGMNTTFRALNESTNEQFVLKRPKESTFTITPALQDIADLIEASASCRYVPDNPDHRIEIQYDQTGLDEFSGRWRYLGGKLLVYIDGVLCCSSAQSLPATHAAGTNRAALENRLAVLLESVLRQEQSTLIANISKCLESYS